MCRWRVGHLVIKTGIIGINADNGHPYSFSSIVNGFDDESYANSGWPVIHDYLRDRSPEEIGIDGAQITHVWCQDIKVSKNIASCSFIDEVVEKPEDMLPHIDALIIARHDYETHYELSKPFLDSGIPVFIDKPLSIEKSDLEYFLPYIEKGQLMSCSALKYSDALKELKKDLISLGDIKYLNTTVCLDWLKYGIHMIDCILELELEEIISIKSSIEDKESFVLTTSSEDNIFINCLGNVGPTFDMSIIGTNGKRTIGMYDNFSAFKNCLKVFFKMCREKKPPIPPSTTLKSMSILSAGLEAKKYTGKIIKI